MVWTKFLRNERLNVTVPANNTHQQAIERQDSPSNVGLGLQLVRAEDSLRPSSAAQVLFGLASAKRISRFDH